VSVFLFAIAIVALAIHFVVYLHYAVSVVKYPFEVFGAEGIVWQQAMLIPSNQMYGDINRFPFIVFHYPPVYHLVVHAAAALGADPLAAGRAISLLASLITGLIIASLSFHITRNGLGRAASLVGALTAGLTFFCFFPVIAVSPLMRVDMLATALSFLGVWCATRSMRRPVLLYAAMILFVIAAFTKQTCVSAPLAVLIVMFPVNRALTLRVFCLAMLLGGIALAILSWITDGGFLRHLVLYNVNRYSVRLAAQQIVSQSPHLVFVALAFVSAVISWKDLAIELKWINLASFRRDLISSEAVQSIAVLVVYLGLSTCTLFALGKSGSGLNYFLEWVGVQSVLIGMLVARVLDKQLKKSQFYLPSFATTFSIGLPILLVYQVLMLPASRDFTPAEGIALQQLNELVDRVRAADKPVLSDDMVLLMKAGKGVPWEPAIFLELTRMGRWDERNIVNMIEDHDFAFVITRGYKDEHFTDAVVGAIETSYPRTEVQAGLTLHFPLKPEE
jgi:hypothetical protein